MHRQYHKWHSPSLGRSMELLEFGYSGANLITFPTSQGTFYEWEDQGMIEPFRHMILQGWLKIICLNSVDRESWYDYGKHPGARAWRQIQYDHYIQYEVLPFVHSRTDNHYIIMTGASFGAFHAVSFGLRHPDLVHRIISMSGLCDIKMFTEGYSDSNVYNVNPVDFIPNEWDSQRLNQLRAQNVILAVGKGDRLIHQNRELSGKLWGKGIGNALREWDGFAHDWPIWKSMLHLYIHGND